MFKIQIDISDFVVVLHFIYTFYNSVREQVGLRPRRKNFSNIPGGMISDVGDDVLKWIERYFQELSFSFEEELNALDNEDGLSNF